MNNGAARYAELRNRNGRVRERALFLPLRIPSELEIQARWFAGEFGKQFVTTAGETIDIVQFGTWNREPGPDFRDAAVSLNGNKPVRGCIEIDLLDRNWEFHGHATNPAFDETVLHVFVDKSDREFFTRTKSHRNVPQVRIDPAVLPEAFSANIPLARLGRCHAPLKDLPEARVRTILDAAAQFRLRKKAALLRARMENHGRDGALFQEIAAALGYKENKLPFTLLAQRLSIKTARENLNATEALLFGLAGFLEAPDLAVYQTPTKEYLRELWDRWWPRRDEMERLILPRKLWRLSGLRPVNHPHRRLGGLAELVRAWPAFRRSLGKVRARHRTSPSDWRTRPAAVTAVRRFFTGLDHTFWRSHYTLAADRSAEPMALIGESRIAEILANVIFPFWLAEDADPSASLGTSLWSEYSKLPARLTNRRLETASARLFGENPRRLQFLKTVAHQQALLQIYEDFCLQDNSDCAQCPFPEQMAKWR